MSTTMKRRERVESGIYRRPDGALEIGWRDAGGKQRWRVVDGGIKAARAELVTEHAKRISGEVVELDPRLTFNVAAEAWWDAHAVRLRDATQSTYAYHLGELRERFGSVRLSAITPSAVARYLARQELRGESGWTLRGRLTVLSAVFRYAARHLGHPGRNPVAELDRVERPNTEDEMPKRVLTDAELEALLEAVPEYDRLFIETIAQTGMRKSEAAGLVWGGVELDAGTLRIDRQLARRSDKRVATLRRSAACGRSRSLRCWRRSCANTAWRPAVPAITSSSSGA